jgi:maleylacetoacetate isomerase
MRSENDQSSGADFALYSYWRSSAAYRVRIALNLKGLVYRTIPIHLVRNGGEQHDEQFRALNPQGLLPVLLDEGKVVTQSLAICEYLDEVYADYPLLPSDPLARAGIRSLALQIACDIHPINNLRVVKYLQSSYGEVVDPVAWMTHWMALGFGALEEQLKHSFEENGAKNDTVYIAGQPGLFECFLVPQVYNAERFGLDMNSFPYIQKIVSRCRNLPSFIDAAPEQQADAV